MRAIYDGSLVCEPRHASWFDAAGESLLVRFEVARVAADPASVPAAAAPGGWGGLTYLRLHGSPRTYWSSYDVERLAAIAARLRAAAGEAWCIFDNTASGAALENAWQCRTNEKGRVVSRPSS